MTTLNIKQNTNHGMLPKSQSHALEPIAADKPGRARNGRLETAGIQHSRGEHSSCQDESSSLLKSEIKEVIPVIKPNHVFVLDKHHQPLMPCHPARAKELLKNGRAVVHRLIPFTIRLKDRTLENSTIQPVVIGIDPGSKTTGLSLSRVDENNNLHVLWTSDLTHRGDRIRDALTQRHGFRKRRRNKLRYRPARFYNRTKPKGWLAPSLMHRVNGVKNWVKRLSAWSPISNIAVETVKFDMQKIRNKEIQGIQYQRGELYGYDVWEYLLERDNRTCVYCDKQNVPFERDHVKPKSKGGSSAVWNLVISCHKCNQTKGNKSLEEFVSDPVRLARIKNILKKPLNDAAAVNSTRNALLKALESFDLPIQTSSGARTKYNRDRLGIPKTHALDAVYVGEMNEIYNWNRQTLHIRSTGRGAYKRTRLDKYGNVLGYLMKEKSVHGFRSGDIVAANIPKGKYKGVHEGRIAIRKSGKFDIQCGSKKIVSNWKHCDVIQKSDGFGYII